MSTKSANAKWIGATVLVSAVVTASVTTAVLTSRKPTAAVEKPSIVYVPLMLGGTDLPAAQAEPIGTAQLTSADMPSATGSPEPPEETAAEPAPAGQSLGDALDALRARYEAATAVATPSAAPMSTVPPPAVTEEPPPTMTMAQPEPQAPPEPPQVGAGAFMTTPTSPWTASNWQSNPNAGAGQFATDHGRIDANAGAGQFSTDQGRIDPSIGAGPFTTEWHTPIIRY